MAEVFYRKWRPRRLDEVVGQAPTAQTLRQAIALGRTAHAYLFCGPRGTGKTSTARILAKAVNCLSPQDGEPDNECPMCRSMNEGRALDLIEIDAASNRGIDDIRSLSDKIHFTPNEARCKVYIIDEVHMLTEPAFNALLKTLEEPPGHAVFILATTEPHKVPLTIISRCQRFDFRRIPLDLMAEKLADVCGREGVEAQPEALRVICRASSGSLRDAENILEQAVVSYGSPLSEDHVRDLLEMSGEETALDLVSLVTSGDLRESLIAINEVVSEGADLRQLHRGAVEYLRAALLLKTGASDSLGYPDSTIDRLKPVADGASVRHLAHTLRIFSQVDLRQDPASPLPLELAVVEACSDPAPPAGRKTPQAAPEAAGAPESSSKPRRPDRAPQEQAAKPPQPSAAQAGQQLEAAVSAPAGAPSSLDAQWSSVIRELRHVGKRFKLGALFQGCKDRDVSGDVVTLRFQYASHAERIDQELSDPGVRGEVEQVMAKAMNGQYSVRVEVIEADENAAGQGAAQRSHLVKAAQAMGAHVIEEKEEYPE